MNPVNDSMVAEAGIRALLRLCGDDPDRPGLSDTPARVVRAYLDACTDGQTTADVLGVVFPDQHDEMVAVGPVEFASLCEHHLWPFTGVAWVAYVPSAGVAAWLRSDFRRDSGRGLGDGEPCEAGGREHEPRRHHFHRTRYRDRKLDRGGRRLRGCRRQFESERL